MKKRSVQSRGFTLLELIVAMTMVAILAASLYATLNTAYRAKASAERRVNPMRAAGIAADIIARDFDSVVRPNQLSTQAVLNTGTTTLYIAGAFTGLTGGGGASQADEVIFCTNGNDGTPDVPLSEGIRQVDIAIDSTTSPPQLVRQVTRNLLSPTMGADAPDVEVLCKNVVAFKVSYGDGVNAGMYANWDSTQLTNADGKTPAIPSYVKFEIVLHVDGVALPGEDPNTYRITRMVQIPCAEAVDASTLFQPGT